MNLDSIPLFDRLEPARSILIAGAGGGFDIFAGLPLYFHFKNAGRDVWLANLSFTPLDAVDGERLSDALVKVTAETKGPGFYFPEGLLCEWLAMSGFDVPIYCFDPTGVQPVLRAYDAVVAEHRIDAILLVDGGTDSLMRGDEFSLGTPEEDLISIAAVHQLEIDLRFLACVGFGVDTFHGVRHGLFLENVSALAKRGGYLGIFPLLAEMDVANKYREASEYVFGRMPNHPSIVNTSILSAVAGEFGDFHATARTAGSRLWINPLMNMYWSFELRTVAEQCLYLDWLLSTETRAAVREGIFNFRQSLAQVRRCGDIPL